MSCLHPPFHFSRRNNGRWSILIDGISVDGKNIAVPPLTAHGAPAGNYITLMDTETPSASFPEDIIRRLMAFIPGSFRLPDGSWSILCDKNEYCERRNRWSTIHDPSSRPFGYRYFDRNNSLNFRFDHHSWQPRIRLALRNHNHAQYLLSVRGSSSRWQLCFLDTLRFNLGDTDTKAPTANATMQFLSQTDPVYARTDVLKVREAELAALQSTGSAPAAAGFVAAADSIPSTPENSNTSFLIKKYGPVINSVPSSPGNSDSASLINKYGPIIIGLLGANLLVVLILAVIELILCCALSAAERLVGRRGTLR
ncbi:Peptidase A1 domain-containing protein [Mycena venus]|uniref:Peptidase A1 domain-containing protein n=1 Tax=Mycena venus TaxID=2733690 RepID=A0A8H7CWH8_9AGAR|nr:Peptidase A1 domain-containing protein [Mycena venus]